MAAAQQQNLPNLSTEDIQRMLEENYMFIKAIVDQQNLGRLPQMMEYQKKLQENLMKLAAVADSHPANTPAPQPTAQQPPGQVAPQAWNQFPPGTQPGQTPAFPGVQPHR